MNVSGRNARNLKYQRKHLAEKTLQDRVHACDTGLYLDLRKLAPHRRKITHLRYGLRPATCRHVVCFQSFMLFPLGRSRGHTCGLQHCAALLVEEHIADHISTS